MFRKPCYIDLSKAVICISKMQKGFNDIEFTSCVPMVVLYSIKFISQLPLLLFFLIICEQNQYAETTINLTNHISRQLWLETRQQKIAATMNQCIKVVKANHT